MVCRRTVASGDQRGDGHERTVDATANPVRETTLLVSGSDNERRGGVGEFDEHRGGVAGHDFEATRDAAEAAQGADGCAEGRLICVSDLGGTEAFVDDLDEAKSSAAAEGFVDGHPRDSLSSAIVEQPGYDVPRLTGHVRRRRARSHDAHASIVL